MDARGGSPRHVRLWQRPARDWRFPLWHQQINDVVTIATSRVRVRLHGFMFAGLTWCLWSSAAAARVAWFLQELLHFLENVLHIVLMRLALQVNQQIVFKSLMQYNILYEMTWLSGKLNVLCSIYVMWLGVYFSVFLYVDWKCKCQCRQANIEFY